ncbi:hypothetical protein NLU13_7756 [Sarocladium strictum]|uniref:Uncharacterized protein n=1 Tax=Sarocladium strictum TaxID=5046 RepID=A0AA39L615_SARSR|nr:hypothetical protein NLU13_7756 [Sarocladium strictum]
MATPVSLCPLKRVEVHDGSTKKTFDSISQSSTLMLSIEAQQSTDAVKPLLLLVHSGSQRLLSVRLSDLLKPTNDGDDIVSNNMIELSLSIRIPSQGQVLAVFFVEMRDHTMTVCTLKKTGFRVKDQGSIPSPNVSLHESTFPPTLGAVARPRLSSITPITSLSQASQVPSMLSTQPVSSNEDHFGGKVWPSYDHGGVSMSQPQLPSHSLISAFNHAPAVPHVASPFVGRPCFPPPISVDAITGSIDSSVAYRPRVSSPLRFAFQSAEPLRSWSNPVAISPYQLPASTYDAVLNSQDSQATDTVQSVLNFQSPAGSHAILGRSFSDLTSSSPDLGALPRENRLPAPNVTFRDFLPAPRQLPFSASTPKDANDPKDKISSKSAVSRKRKIPADDAAPKQPKKSRMAKTTLEKDFASTSVLQMKKKTLRRGSRASHKAAPTVTSRSLKAEVLVGDGHSMHTAQGSEEPVLKGRTTAVMYPAPTEGPTTRKSKAGLSVNALSPTEKHKDQPCEISSRKEQTTRKPTKRLLNGASTDPREETHTQKKTSAPGKSSCAALPSQGFTEPINQAPASTRPKRDPKKVSRMARVQVEECQQAQQVQRSLSSGPPQKKPQQRPKSALKKSKTKPIAVKDIPALEQNAHALLNVKQKGSSSNKRRPKVTASTSKNKQGKGHSVYGVLAPSF